MFMKNDLIRYTDASQRTLRVEVGAPGEDQPVDDRREPGVRVTRRQHDRASAGVPMGMRARSNGSTRASGGSCARNRLGSR